MKQVIWSLGGHLGACLIITAIAVLLSLIFPGTAPYAFAWAVCSSLCIMSVWDAGNFHLQARHVYAYLAAIAVMIVGCLFGILDWIAGWDLIPIPWRYVFVFESLPLACLFIFFIAIIIDSEDNPFACCYPVGNEYTDGRQPA